MGVGRGLTHEMQQPSRGMASILEHSRRKQYRRARTADYRGHTLTANETRDEIAAHGLSAQIVEPAEVTISHPRNHRIAKLN